MGAIVGDIESESATNGCSNESVGFAVLAVFDLYIVGDFVFLVGWGVGVTTACIKVGFDEEPFAAADGFPLGSFVEGLSVGRLDGFDVGLKVGTTLEGDKVGLLVLGLSVG